MGGFHGQYGAAIVTMPSESADRFWSTRRSTLPHAGSECGGDGGVECGIDLSSPPFRKKRERMGQPQQ